MFAKTLAAVLLSTAFTAHVQAAPAPLPFKTITLEAKIDNHGNYHESTVAYPVTGDRHLDNWVRKQMGGRLPTRRSVQAALNRSEDVKLANQSNREIRRNSGDSNICSLRLIDTLELGGYTPHYAVFDREDWQYLCGTHGNGVQTLTVLKRDTPNPKPLTLDDILLPGQKAKLTHLLKEAYIKYLTGTFEDSEQAAREYADNFNKEGFPATGNWRFDKNGLTFLYQTYEIGAYFLGRPELTIPVKDLQGIIKPEILRETQHYRAKPER